MDIDIDDLLPGTRIRTKRAGEMLPPDWHLDHSSGGQFYVCYHPPRTISTGLLGREYTVETVNRHNGEVWVRDDSRWGIIIYDTLVAEILGEGAGPRRDATSCDCGHDAAGRHAVGGHSYWCSTQVVGRGERSTDADDSAE